MLDSKSSVTLAAQGMHVGREESQLPLRYLWKKTQTLLTDNMSGIVKKGILI